MGLGIVLQVSIPTTKNSVRRVAGLGSEICDLPAVANFSRCGTVLYASKTIKSLTVGINTPHHLVSAICQNITWEDLINSGTVGPSK